MSVVGMPQKGQKHLLGEIEGLERRLSELHALSGRVADALIPVLSQEPTAIERDPDPPPESCEVITRLVLAQRQADSTTSVLRDILDRLRVGHAPANGLISGLHG